MTIQISRPPGFLNFRSDVRWRVMEREPRSALLRRRIERGQQPFWDGQMDTQYSAASPTSAWKISLLRGHQEAEERERRTRTRTTSTDDRTTYSGSSHLREEIWSRAPPAMNLSQTEYGDQFSQPPSTMMLRLKTSE